MDGVFHGGYMGFSNGRLNQLMVWYGLIWFDGVHKCGYPFIAGWFISWNIPSRNGWWLGGTPIYGNLHMAQIGIMRLDNGVDTEIHLDIRVQNLLLQLSSSVNKPLDFWGEDYASHGNSWIYLPFEVPGKKSNDNVPMGGISEFDVSLQASHYIAYRWGEVAMLSGAGNCWHQTMRNVLRTKI